MPQPLYSVQALRALAVTMVVITHLGRSLMLKAGTDVTEITAVGSAGVDVFFVISGFIMVHTTSQRFSARDFMRQRLTRIAPLYWLATITYVAIVLSAPGLFHFYQFRLDNFLLAILFLPSRSAAGDILPPLEQGWTLVYEMFFYVVFALASYLAFRRRIALLAVVFCALVAAGSAFQPTENALALTYTSTLLFEFLIGCMLADLLDRSFLQLGVPASMVCVASAALGLAVSPLLMHAGYDRLIYWGVPASLLVLGLVRLEHVVAFRKLRVIQEIGNGSYSIYLSHVMALSVLSLAFRFGWARWQGGIPLALVFLVVCLLAGWLCSRWIERALTQSVRRLTGARPASRALQSEALVAADARRV